MRSSRTERKYLLLDLYSCYLLPAYTLLFAGSSGWFDTNFSVLAVSGPERYQSFLLWGVVTAGYFGVLLIRVIVALSPARRIAVRILLGAALFQLMLGILLPYLPERFPRLSTVHIVLCFSTSVSVMSALLVTILELYRRERERYLPVLRCWWRIVVGSGILFFLAGMVSSALEIYFVLSAVLLCRRLYQLQEE